MPDSAGHTVGDPIEHRKNGPSYLGRPDDGNCLGKSAVASVFGRKFLGYSLWVAPGGVVKPEVAARPLQAFKHRIRELTGRSGGPSIKEVVARLRPYVLGCKAYFRLAQTPKVWRELDEWLRHRLRAIQLKHWRRGTTIYRELRALGGKSCGSPTSGGDQSPLVV